VEEIMLDGIALGGGVVPLDDDGREHVVVVRMRREPLNRT
jgi:hypothetical protein